MKLLYARWLDFCLREAEMKFHQKPIKPKICPGEPEGVIPYCGDRQMSNLKDHLINLAVLELHLLRDDEKKHMPTKGYIRIVLSSAEYIDEPSCIG